MIGLCLGLLAIWTIIAGPGQEPTWHWLMKVGSIALCNALYLRLLFVYGRSQR
jgi:hypothetical protein